MKELEASCDVKVREILRHDTHLFPFLFAKTQPLLVATMAIRGSGATVQANQVNGRYEALC